MIPRTLIPMLVAGLMAVDSTDVTERQPHHPTATTVISQTVTEGESAGKVTTIKEVSAAEIAAEDARRIDLLISAEKLDGAQVSTDAPVIVTAPQTSTVAVTAAAATKPTPEEPLPPLKTRKRHPTISMDEFVKLIPDEIVHPYLYVTESVESVRKQILRQCVREKFLRRASVRN